MTNDENISLLTQMRKARGTYEAVFIQFVNNRKYHNSHAFCFYEGEDGKYYDPRIRQKFSDRFMTFIAGNKKEVIKLLKKINSEDLYKDVCIMFFVDRDYDKSLMGEDENVFETPCYSIENLYAQEECLKKILQSEFGLNIVDEDFQKCLQDFHLRAKEFKECILEFNALAYLRRQQSDSNSNYSFGSIKTSHLAKVGVSKVERSSRYTDTIQEIKDKLQFSEEDIERAKNILNEQGDFSMNFRGKNQLDFFVAFIRELKSLNSAGGYFSEKYNNIYINITSNRLSELSQYAITPSSLEKFLDVHLGKLSAQTSV
ncbi:MAG: DUF4435 domain-containing protein [Clostridiales bacterium]|nr:DUF4435 domain-containing protein [Clostridiales bacterium]